MVEIDAERFQRGVVLADEVGEKNLHRMAEEHGVGDLHHGGLEMEREKQAEFGRGGDLFFEKCDQSFCAHESRVENLSSLQLDPLLQDDRRSSGGGEEFDGCCGGRGDRHGLLVRKEVIRVHGGHAGLGIRRPCSHLVRMLAGIVFDRFGCPAVGVAFAQDGIDCAALYFVIPRLGLLLRAGGGCFRVVGEGKTLRLQLGDRCFELGHRGAYVGKFDDVGPGLKGQGAELGQGIGRLLPGRQKVGKSGKDASG